MGVLLLSLLASCFSWAQDYRVVTQAIIPVRKPAFQSLAVNSSTGVPSLFVSSFDLVGRDAIYEIVDPAQIFKHHALEMNLVTDAVTWPNEVTPLAKDIFGAEGELITSGFLFPSKSTGGVFFLDSAGLLTQLTQEKSGYFYHRAVFADVSGSGRLDMLTARAKVPLIGAADGELVWLKRPKNPLTQPWQEVVLAKGPDMHFRVATNPADSSLVVLAAEYSTGRISVHWVEKNGPHSRVIDNTLGHAFDLELADLNNDGVLDLLVTNHEGQKEKSAVFAYILPDDYKTGSWVRKTLLAGIETRQPGINSASPGAAKAFYPDLSKQGVLKPWIAVSGDGSRRLHLLQPLSEDTSDWRYHEIIALDVKSTIGEPLISDFDGDGYADISVPAYDNNQIYFLSLKPKDDHR